MRLDAPAGTKVRFAGATDAQVRFGGHDDPRASLKTGAVYTVREVRVRDWSSSVALAGIDGWFNTVCFEEVGA